MKKINTVKWGIIGTGSIASSFAHSIKNSRNANLISVYGRSNSKLSDFSKKFNLKGFNSLDQFLSSKDIDAIYIATPHSSHFLYSYEAIKNKKHVLCEKPIALNSSESMVLVYEARKNKVFLMEAFMYRTHPQTQNIIELAKKEFAGKKIKIESSFGFNLSLIHI